MKFITYKEKRNGENRLIRRYKVYNFGLFKIKKKVLPVLGENNKIIVGGRELTEKDKKILDKAGKITIEGNNNIVELSDMEDLKCNIRIEGDSNIVELHDVRELKMICDIKIDGNNNIIKANQEKNEKVEKNISDNFLKFAINSNNNFFELKDITNLRNCDCSVLSGNSNKVSIGKIILDATLKILFKGNGDNRELIIDDSKYIGDCEFILTGNNRKIHVGKDCMFSIEIIVRTSDEHPIYDLGTNKRINEEQDVIIGEHVWIARNVTILKGSVIPSGCVIGTKSLVNKAFTKENCIIAGIPAKVVKENICWEVELPRE